MHNEIKNEKIMNDKTNSEEAMSDKAKKDKKEKKKVFSSIKSGINRIYDKIPKKESKLYDGKIHQEHFILKLALASLLIYLYIEEFARITTSIAGGFLMIVNQPLVFLYNWLIIFTTLSISLLFKRRNFVATAAGLFWITLGTGNGIILTKRMTPFTVYDMQNLKDGLTLVTQYFKIWQLIMLIIVIAFAVVFLIIFFFASKKWCNLNWKKNIITLVLLVALLAGSTAGLLKIGKLSTYFGNLNYAYTDYGFPYGFINTTANTGINKPFGYSEASINEILKNDTYTGGKFNPDEYSEKTWQGAYKSPNIIVLQLESFSLAQDYNHISTSNDPTPVFNKLREEYSTGWFKVPACGAGTANTEFEVLTGISSRFFGPGEYPYKGKLREQTQESLASVLKKNGYYTAAMHNHRALFYNRNEVYPNLGFDSYTSVEYMNDVERTPVGWAKDSTMTDDIMEIMKSTKESDFMHIVSVQGHGAYPKDQIFSSPYTSVTANNNTTKYKYEYYVNECYEMDKFLGDLIEEINKAGEPTIMLVYGDHIPALDIKESEYANGDLYKTRYVIWDNIGLPKVDGNLKAYEAGARLLEDAGIVAQGAIFDYQQTANRVNKKDYLRKLKAISYDEMYGNNFVFGGKRPYKKTNMKMGFKDIKAEKIVKIGGSYYITGQNFTESSSFSLNGKILNTIYLSPELIGLKEKLDPKDIKKLKVSQIDRKENSILTTINTLEEL